MTDARRIRLIAALALPLVDDATADACGRFSTPTGRVETRNAAPR